MKWRDYLAILVVQIGRSGYGYSDYSGKRGEEPLQQPHQGSGAVGGSFHRGEQGAQGRANRTV